MPSRSSSYQRLWKYSLAIIIFVMMELGLGIADIIIKCPICKEASYIPAACFALPVWTPLLLIGTSALGLMTGPEATNRNKLLRWCLVLSFISIAVCLVVIGWCVTNIVQSVSTGLLAAIGMKSIALAALIIIVSLVEICLFIAFSLNSIDLIDRNSKKGDGDDGSGLSEDPAINKATRKGKQKQWIFDHNATLINLPKVHPPPDDSIPKRPSVMELMKTHFQTNKSLLIPSTSNVSGSQLPDAVGTATSEQRNSGIYDNATPLEMADKANGKLQNSITDNAKPQISATHSVRPEKFATDNVKPQNSGVDKGNIGARDSFKAIRAFFDNNTHRMPGNSSGLPAKSKQTVADIHIISNNALGGASNAGFTLKDGSSELQEMPKFLNMQMPPTHGKLQARRGSLGASVDNARTAKVSFVLNSLERR